MEKQGIVKYTAGILVFLLVLGLMAPLASAAVIYEEDVAEAVARGITYRMKWQFSQEGWLRLHVIEVDLADPHVKLDLLYNEEELATPRSLLQMARERGAVAALNGDFFYQEGGYSVPVGPMGREGRLLASPGNAHMGVFALTKDGKIELANWRGEGCVQIPGQGPLPLAGVNKPGTDYAWPILYTPDWGRTSPATPPGSVTLIGLGSTVVRLSAEGEQPIPSGAGFALVAGGGAAEHLRRFAPGDTIEYSYSTKPDGNNYRLALGGGAILLRGGKIVPAGHDVPGRHPRSAAGVSADGKTLYLVAVDGRQDESRGLTQEELARVLLDLGAWEAINFDGGGSTTLISRPLGYEEGVVKNVPPGGSLRKIPNGLGLFTSRTAGPAVGLLISAADENVVLNGTRRLQLRAYDAAYNPVPLPPGQPTYEVVPRELGQVVEGVFQPQKMGRGLIKVRLGDLAGELRLRVIGPAVRLSLTPEKISMEPGEEKSFTLTALDARGYKAVVENTDASYEVRGEVGTMAAGLLRAAKNPASGAVIARLGQAVAGAQVLVGREASTLNPLTSKGDVSFLSWPQGLPGGIGYSKPPEPLTGREESTVLALNYDLTPKGDATRAAYVVLGEEGLQLKKDSQSVGLWVYGDGSGHYLRGQLKDGEGLLVPLDFARRLDWQGWRYVRSNLPSTAPRPLTLTRVYLVEPDGARGEKGTIYLADLQEERPLSWADELLPQIEEPREPPQALAGEEFPSGTRLIVVGNISSTLDKGAVARALQAKKEAWGASYIISTDPLPGKDESPSPLLPSGAFPTSFRSQDFSSLHLEAGLGGLRETNFQQWPYLQQELGRVPADLPLLVFSNRPPYKGDVPGLGFNNRAEAALLRQYLREQQENNGQDVWVLCGGLPAGADPYWRLEEGVLYLGLPPVTSVNDFPYLLLTLSPTGPVYSWQGVGKVATPGR